MFFLSLIVTGKAQGHEPIDSIGIDLEGIEVSADRSLNLSKGGNMRYNPDDIYGHLRIMGEADIIGELKRLPGSLSRGDFGSGVMIDGANPSQMIYRLDRVPVFFPYRFGGVFSTFNTPFYSRIDFERGFHKAEMPSRLGAKVDLSTIKKASAVSGTFNVGLLSSSLVLSVPMGERFLINVGGRISYVDELYGPFLKKDMDIRYRFHDLNLNAAYHVDKSNTLSLNLFESYDKLRYADDKYTTEDYMAWENKLASLTWRREGTVKMEHRVYFSSFSNKFDVVMSNLMLKMPSSLWMLGASGDISDIELSRNCVLTAGYELNFYKNRPQEMWIDGYGEDREENSVAVLNPIESRVFGDLKIYVADYLNIFAGLSLGYYYNTNHYNSFSVDPRVTLNFPVGAGAFNFHIGTYSQYIHQIGFSEAGLASDFMVVSGKDLPVERSVSFEADYTGMLPYGFNVSLNVYYRIISHESEYEGSLLNVLDNGYDMYSHIKSYNGFNTGVNLLARKAFGKFRVDFGTGYGIARRRRQDFRNYIRGRSEPGFSINAGVAYIPNVHWEFNANFRYNTGRPYTPVTAIYMIAGNVMMEYGVPNSSNFPSWQQLDLGATWKLFSGQNSKFPLTHLINVSLINAYGHRNTEMMTYTYNPEENVFHLKKINSLFRFLPSLSYSLKF